METVLTATEEEAVNSVKQFSEARGMTFFVHTFMSDIATETVTRGADDWRESYFGQDMFMDDPVVSHSLHTTSAFTWDDPRFQKSLTDKDQTFMREAAGHGLKAGLSIPIPLVAGGLGLASFASEERTSFTDVEIWEFQHAAAHFHMRRAPGQNSDAIQLPNRVVECLTWAAAGKTEWETGQILGIHEATVKEYIKRGRIALNASNKVQAVATAVRLGLVRL